MPAAPTGLAPEIEALIATWRDQGKGLREIARELNRRNIGRPGGALAFAERSRIGFTGPPASELPKEL